MATSVVGRDAELASILDFVTHMSREAAALVLEGEAGMGKTTLWRAALERAEESGVRVLQAQPVESETTLSFAGLGDLLDPVLDLIDGTLPTVQERALMRALALGADDEADLDPRTLRVAVMNVIRRVSEEQPVQLDRRSDAFDRTVVVNESPYITSERSVPSGTDVSTYLDANERTPVLSNPTVAPTSSGDGIDWPQIGIGFGVGILLAVLLGLSLKATRPRTLAH
jgi:hypothetical protein